MDSISKLEHISWRLAHIEFAGDWLAKALSESDAVASHTGELISALADDVRERLLELVTELEKEIALSPRQH